VCIPFVVLYCTGGAVCSLRVLHEVIGRSVSIVSVQSLFYADLHKWCMCFAVNDSLRLLELSL
jgi:hypothetical protein